MAKKVVIYEKHPNEGRYDLNTMGGSKTALGSHKKNTNSVLVPSITLKPSDPKRSLMSQLASPRETSVDAKLSRKIACLQKAFTTQIDSLPGPKAHALKYAGQRFKASKDEEFKLGEPKTKLKQN